MKKLFLFFISILASSSAFAYTCSDIDGAWLYSPKNNGTYLGFFGTQFAADSINNQFGTYGSEFNAASIRNSFGDFGSGFSQYSVANNFASDPPQIYKYGIFIGYLSTNSFKSPQATLAEVDASCDFTSTVEFGVPSPLVSLSASQGTFTNAVDLTYNVGVGTASVTVYQCETSACSSLTLLGVTSSLSTQITGLLPATTYYFSVYPTNLRGIGTGRSVAGSTGTVPDDTPPVISLVGSAEISQIFGASYTDAGATATDNVDGNITANIALSGTVDVNTLGTYTLTYTVSDAAGNAASAVTRTVTVETDTDQDGIADSLDTDDDNDGVLDGDDAFRLISLDGRTDTDNDGRPNDCDTTCESTGMASDTDDDNDGLSDEIEAGLGTNPLYFDTDFDSISDYEEVQVTRDPLVPDYILASGRDICIQDDEAIKCGYRQAIDFVGMDEMFPAAEIEMTEVEGRTCALRKKDGKIRCWNLDGSGAFVGTEGYTDVAAGERHTCGIKAGAVECFGNNSFGQLKVPDLVAPSSITAGMRFTCAIDDGAVICWGTDVEGELSPPETVNPRQISSSPYHSCVLDDNGVQCWGANDRGQLNVPELSNPKFIDVGRYSSCALDDTGAVCWGNLYGNPPSSTSGYQLAWEKRGVLLDNNGVTIWGEVATQVYADFVFKDFDADGIKDLDDTDDDGDGVADINDAYPLISVGSLTDTDADGAPDDCNSICEAAQMSADTDDDGDGVADINDAFPLDATETIDTDRDGIGNNADADDDNDGVADINDAFPLDPTEALDTDRDGTGNNADTDDDGDGLSDDAEINVHGTNPLLADTDGDSMDDGLEIEEGLNPLDDNDCPGWYCSSSKVYLYKIAAERADSDRDGLTNKIEESLGTDSNNPDSDGDGLSDGDEVNIYKTDPIVADTDGDGLSDGAEVNIHGTQPLVSDTDGDSVSDGEEIQEGLDPLVDDCPAWICGSSRPWLYIINP